MESKFFMAKITTPLLPIVSNMIKQIHFFTHNILEGPIYSKSLLQSYISNQRKPAQHVTGVPEMKCDPQLKPPQMKKKDAGFVLLHDNASR